MIKNYLGKITIVALLGIIFAVYISPYVSMWRLESAIKNKNTDAVMHYLDTEAIEFNTGDSLFAAFNNNVNDISRSKSFNVNDLKLSQAILATDLKSVFNANNIEKTLANPDDMTVENRRLVLALMVASNPSTDFQNLLDYDPRDYEFGASASLQGELTFNNQDPDFNKNWMAAKENLAEYTKGVHLNTKEGYCGYRCFVVHEQYDDISTNIWLRRDGLFTWKVFHLEFFY